MDNLRCRARLSVLWIFIATLSAVWFGLALWFPGIIEDVIAGQYGVMQINDGFLLLILIPFTLIPMIMAVLCFSLKDKANRWVNFIVAILLGVLFIFSAFDPVEDPSVVTMTFDIGAIVIAALIAWFAWKLPKQQV